MVGGIFKVIHLFKATRSNQNNVCEETQEEAERLKCKHILPPQIATRFHRVTFGVKKRLRRFSSVLSTSLAFHVIGEWLKVFCLHPLNVCASICLGENHF